MLLALAGLLPALLQITMDSGLTVVQSVSGVDPPTAAGVTLGSTALAKDRAGEPGTTAIGPSRLVLDEHGIAAGRLAMQGFGLSRPLEPNSTVEGRARNRRVELVRPC